MRLFDIINENVVKDKFKWYLSKILDGRMITNEGNIGAFDTREEVFAAAREDILDYLIQKAEAEDDYDTPGEEFEAEADQEASRFAHAWEQTQFNSIYDGQPMAYIGGVDDYTYVVKRGSYPMHYDIQTGDQHTNLYKEYGGPTPEDVARREQARRFVELLARAHETGNYTQIRREFGDNVDPREHLRLVQSEENE